MSEMTKEEQTQQMRLAMLQSFENFYSQMMGFLIKLPIQQQFKMYAFMNFDQGAFWAREALKTLPVTFPEKTAAPEEAVRENAQASENKEASAEPQVNEEAPKNCESEQTQEPQKVE